MCDVECVQAGVQENVAREQHVGIIHNGIGHGGGQTANAQPCRDGGASRIIRAEIDSVDRGRPIRGAKRPTPDRSGETRLCERRVTRRASIWKTRPDIYGNRGLGCSRKSASGDRTEKNFFEWHNAPFEKNERKLCELPLREPPLTPAAS